MERDSERGLALISVMWFLLVMALIVGAVLAGTRSHYVSVRAHERVLILKYVAEGAVDRAILEIAGSRNDPAGKIGKKRNYALDGTPVSVKIISESGKLNINLAGVKLITSLIGTHISDTTQSRALAEAIVDWRDPDDVRLPKGAEALDYRDAGYPYGPRNGPFRTLGELLQVRGMTRELFACLKPDITIYTSGGIDETRTSPTLAKALKTFRDEDKTTGSQASILNRPQGGRGQVFRIEAIARGRGEARYGISAIVRMTNSHSDPYWSLSWLVSRTSNEARQCMPIVSDAAP